MSRMILSPEAVGYMMDDGWRFVVTDNDARWMLLEGERIVARQGDDKWREDLEIALVMCGA